MVLLRALHDLSQTHEWKLTVAHLNHQLRGKASDADAELVRQKARALHLPVMVKRADVRGFSRKHTVSLEMAARKLRHQFLAGTARQLGIDTVAMGHHADDQLELFFLRLFRGSGTSALAGMKWQSSSPSDARVHLVRPLLDLPKSLLAEYARENNIDFREDASNRCLDFQRNRIRHELLPLLRRKYQPALHKTIARMMEIIGAEAEFVTEAAASRLKPLPAQGRRRASRKQNCAEKFDALPVAVQRRFIQLQLQGLGIEADFELIEQLRHLPERPITVAALSGPQLVLRERDGVLKLRPPETAHFRQNVASIQLQGRSGGAVLDGVRISWQIDSKKANRLPQHKTDCEYFDADKIGGKMTFRHWQAGDRFQPIGFSKAIKLQDFFTNEKIPRALRHELIIGVAARGELFWVENLRISERFKLTKATKRRLQWRWRRV